MSTPPNEAKPGEIAKTVLMPGDPLRAKFIAERYLEDVKQVNSVRNMLAFTGYYSTNSSWSEQYHLGGTYSAIASYPVMEEAINASKKFGYRFKVGQVLSSDNFYGEEWEPWANMGILACEMEAYGLYCVAAQLHKEALTILTISDSLVEHAETTAEEREKSFTNMMDVALECIKE